MMTKIEKRILKTIKNHKMTKRGGSVLIALSGGADSVMLTLVLSKLADELDIRLYAAHINHCIRGEAAINDARFSEELCKRLNIKFFTKSFDVPSIAKSRRVSEETAGRDVRYSYFNELLTKYNIDSVATAHHADDRAETVLMNIIRGSGLKGLRGIQYVNGNIIRPLLDISKDDILEYLKSLNENYCTDETNFNTEYTRNKIRNDVIPKLKEINPSVVDCINRESELASIDNDYLDKITETEYNKLITEKGIEVKRLISLHKCLVRRIIYMMYERCLGSSVNIGFGDVDSIVDLCFSDKTGKYITLSAGYTASIDYGFLSIKKVVAAIDFEYQIKPEIPIVIKELGIKVTIVRKQSARKLALNINKDDMLVIRNKRDGDYIYPTGMTGRKKLKDLFVDKKISRTERLRQPILTVGGEIASVINLRDDRRFFTKDGEYEIITEKIQEAVF